MTLADYLTAQINQGIAQAQPALDAMHRLAHNPATPTSHQ